MGAAKRLLEEEHRKFGIATGIAIEAKALRLCEIHEIAYDAGGDIEAAYRLGNYQFTNGQLSEIFDSRREMTDFIKRAIQEHAADECGMCAKNAAE